ncbi:hypothetical protein ADICYQ_3287 [Cyclobacterium qasimii M12-11B]|uniref:Uncharacterized protein n=1 Tax=Cyclobacterium qasimii M12-11B TaxID=641524 RepID=S7VDM1_9BACT|nr:hypothetical protein ADICYQ_3287 [Cyclobacterium qasimii M12-11B]
MSIHFTLRFTYSLDLFGSFLDQAKNEQEGIRVINNLCLKIILRG